MEQGTLISFSYRLLGQLHKVFDCFRDGFSKETDLNTTDGLTANFDVKPYLRNYVIVIVIAYTRCKLDLNITTYFVSYFRTFFPIGQDTGNKANQK